MTAAVSVRNWWVVCLTRSSISSKTDTWPTNVSKNDFYQCYIDACVGTPVTKPKFWHNMNKWSPWTSRDFPMGLSFSLRPLAECRNIFNKSRDWFNNNVFVPNFNLNMIPPSLTGWWGEVLVTGRWFNRPVNKTTLYNDYVRFATTERLPVASQPRFWRFLYHVRSKTAEAANASETWDTITLGDIETLRKTNSTPYSKMLNQYNVAFGIHEAVETTSASA